MPILAGTSLAQAAELEISKTNPGQALGRNGQDHNALRGFVLDACEVAGHADAAATRAALIKRTGASDRELLTAALDLLRERDALGLLRERDAE